MTLEKKIIRQGDGHTYRRPGDAVTMGYTGKDHRTLSELYVTVCKAGYMNPMRQISAATSKLARQSWTHIPNNRVRFDSSIGRADLSTSIDVGRVVEGWDKRVSTMSLSDKTVSRGNTDPRPLQT